MEKDNLGDWVIAGGLRDIAIKIIASARGAGLADAVTYPPLPVTVLRLLRHMGDGRLNGEGFDLRCVIETYDGGAPLVSARLQWQRRREREHNGNPLRFTTHNARRSSSFGDRLKPNELLTERPLNRDGFTVLRE